MRPFEILSLPAFIAIRDNRRPSEAPLVISKNNGHPGTLQDITGQALPWGFSTVADIILGIVTVEATSYLLVGTQRKDAGVLRHQAISKLTEVKAISFQADNYMEANPNPLLQEITTYLGSGLFYFSYEYPLTHSLQNQYGRPPVPPHELWKDADPKFFWNAHLMKFFINRELNNFIVPIICGFVNIVTMKDVTKGEKISFGIISRLSCMRAGTRYNSRGINDDGDVSNFVETEQILKTDGRYMSFVQIRGSVPLFWEQIPSGATFVAEIRRNLDVSREAFSKHVSSILYAYDRVFMINLLEAGNTKKIAELQLTMGFENQYLYWLNFHPGLDSLKYLHWDFHAHCGTSNYANMSKMLKSTEVEEERLRFRFFHVDRDGNLIEKQRGTFRVNCMDCLDRTNVVMGALARSSVEMQLSSLPLPTGFLAALADENSPLTLSFKTLWADNGDNLSKAYAGTAALKSTFTRTGKNSTLGLVKDGIKSVSRSFIQNFYDDQKQQAIYSILGLTPPIPESFKPYRERWVDSQVRIRKSLYAKFDSSRIYVGTWNVKGFVPNEDTTNLGPWISPEYPNARDIDHDAISIYVFGLQEVVRTSAEALVGWAEEEKNLMAWTKVLTHRINQLRSKSKVVAYSNPQMLGLGVIIFVARDKLHYMKNFTICKSKVAVGGLSEARGGLACRFDFHNTSFCFVCAHLSGGKDNHQDRVNDVSEIFSQTHFIQTPKHATIKKHDYVFWFGDMGFRLDGTLSESEVLARLENKTLTLLLSKDKLNQKLTTIFGNGYKEGSIAFPPTYKYNIEGDPDTYVPKTIPAWSDRIVYKCNSGFSMEQLVYTRGEGVFVSDHRPVKSLFDVDILMIDKEKEQEIIEEMEAVSKTLPLEVLKNADVPYGITMDINESRSTKIRRRGSIRASVVSPISGHLASLVAIHAHFSTCFGDRTAVMSSVNLTAMTMKSLLRLLQRFKSCVHAQALANSLLRQVSTLTSAAKQCMARFNQEVYFTQLVGIVNEIIKSVTSALPHIV
eukprot:TRINITY_DN7085_c0_g1_i1.p1 TRINITY_DN7085_c0_g1~~TRINITY_DN7085_c0_g1_i1.p1  ORF type:complete len:1077 (+),score=183.23 TRINITY_DN7085_c0_g1_i1:182-3232(+)